MNSFVASHPADDLRLLRRVLMTSPLGRTTVYTTSKASGNGEKRMLARFRNHSAFAVLADDMNISVKDDTKCSYPYLTALAGVQVSLSSRMRADMWTDCRYIPSPPFLR